MQILQKSKIKVFYIELHKSDRDSGQNTKDKFSSSFLGKNDQRICSQGEEMLHIITQESACVLLGFKST